MGDIMLGDNHLHINRGVASTWKNQTLETVLAHLKNVLSGDIVIGNLECILGKIDSMNPLKRTYTASPDRAKELKNIGFTHLGLANNHILEQGLELSIQTKKIVQDAGLITCGTTNPTCTKVKGNMVEIYTYSIVKERYQNAFYANQVSLDDLNKMESSSADYKIVFLHWGDEYSLYPSRSQRELGHEILGRGATLVIGHHPHVLQGIAQKNNGLIAYSLGNFIFDQNWSSETQRGAILHVDLSDGKVVNFETIVTCQDNAYVPHITNCELNDFFDHPVDWFLDRDIEYAKYIKGKKSWARKTMKKEVAKNIRHVSLLTLLHPLVKRCNFFIPSGKRLK